MAYINFKEEISAAKTQLEKRIHNNVKIFEKLSESKDVYKEFNPNDRYSFKEHNNLVIGGGHPKKEDEFQEFKDEDIVCAKFVKCRFSNVKFSNCKFIGCYFEECELMGGGVVFQDCIFVKKDKDDKPNLNKEDNFSCEFNHCNIYAKFINCTLEFIIFNKCILKNTNFELSDMSNGIIYDSTLEMIIISDTNLSGTKIVSTYIEDLEFRDKYKTKLDEKTFIDKIKFRKRNRNEYEGIYTVYENIADKFNDNNLKNNFGEYYFLCRKVQRKTLKPMPKIASTLGLVSCGYGERPMYAVYFSLFVIALFSILYLIFGMKVNEEIITYDNINKFHNLRKMLTDYNESLNLSVGMFAGVGLNEAQPSPRSYMLSNIEMLIGVLMMGVGIGALVKKIVR
ncbi:MULTISPECIES: pentapeptide repeat-containing protein [unclassified Clostridium]|uniref:pentapeptide repeat-containing protein n=1 Tax=unclassified Clostridium TaxID=2614128 RepID=UPI0025C540D0|nr:pentapeptide repeat-containing protein [Clostridium sp.]MDY4253022.1 pentapeptide repeat-containing protein [Clostridium sp.]MDY6228640.1 pentapeptide repeat-containing protein [Clostridium sp.]